MEQGRVSVGVVGLGQMGLPIAGHLLDAGYDVGGFDRAEERVAAFVARGGAPAASPAGLAARCDVVLTSLPSGAALMDVIGRPRGLLGVEDRRTTIVIETSTLSLSDKEQARAVAADGGVTLLDCPLSGTGAQARTKDLVVLVSGDADAARRCEGVFAAFARQRFDLGAFGNGSRAKYIANLLVTIHNLAAAEALVLGRKAGLDPATVLEVVESGAGGSRMLEVRGPSMVQRDYGGAGVSLNVFAKDLSIIAEFAWELRCPTPLFSVASSYYTSALAHGHGSSDTAVVHAVLEAMAGLGQ